MDWCIYVGASASNNFQLGLDSGTWGHKVIFSGNQLQDIKPGDRVYFVHYLQQLRQAKDPNQNGFPRVSIESLYGVIKSLTECVVTSEYYFDDSQLWPDDVYPHRFNFNVVRETKTLHFGLEFFSEDFISAVQKSLLRKGLPFPFYSGETIYSPKESEEFEAIEGGPIYRTHKKRDRDKKIIELKKEATIRSGKKLDCEACGFDFEKTYGIRGKHFIECHHINPLADTEVDQKTKLDDLALLCSNCHRMIHRQKPWLKLEELREIITFKAPQPQ